jgi:hypothetical protein
MAEDFTLAGPGRNVAVVSMVSLNGYLYVGTQNDEAGFQLFRSNAASPDDPQPGEWTRIIEYGAGDMANTRALTMTAFRDTLYVGTSMFPVTSNAPYLLPAKGCELLRVAADDTWELLVGDITPQIPPPGDPTIRTPLSVYRGGFGNVLNIYCWAMQEFDGVLYVATFDLNSVVYYLLDPLQLLFAANAGADLWKTEDGITWKTITLNGFDNPGNYGIRTMIRTGDSLIMGTANVYTGLDMFQATAPPAPQPCGTWVTRGGPAESQDIFQLLITCLMFAVPTLALLGVQRRRFRRLR